MVVGLLRSLSHLIYKLTCRFEVRKTKDPLNRASVTLPAIQRAQFFLDFCIREDCHKHLSDRRPKGVILVPCREKCSTAAYFNLAGRNHPGQGSVLRGAACASQRGYLLHGISEMID